MSTRPAGKRPLEVDAGNTVISPPNKRSKTNSEAQAPLEIAPIEHDKECSWPHASRPLVCPQLPISIGSRRTLYQNILRAMGEEKAAECLKSFEAMNTAWYEKQAEGGPTTPASGNVLHARNTTLDVELEHPLPTLAAPRKNTSGRLGGGCNDEPAPRFGTLSPPPNRLRFPSPSPKTPKFPENPFEVGNRGEQDTDMQEMSPIDGGHNLFPPRHRLRFQTPSPTTPNFSEHPFEVRDRSEQDTDMQDMSPIDGSHIGEDGPFEKSGMFSAGSEHFEDRMEMVETQETHDEHDAEMQDNRLDGDDMSQPPADTISGEAGSGARKESGRLRSIWNWLVEADTESSKAGPGALERDVPSWMPEVWVVAANTMMGRQG